MDKYNKLKGKHHRMTELCADQQRRIAELEGDLKEIRKLIQICLDITFSKK
jgi:hypothetical protein